MPSSVRHHLQVAEHVKEKVLARLNDVCTESLHCDIAELEVRRWRRLEDKQIPARQNCDFGWNVAYFPLIFRLFSAYGTPSAVFKPTYLWNSPISLYFPPIFCLKWYPILVINSRMEPICCFSPTCLWILPFRLFSAHFLPIFHLTICPYSASPVLPGRWLGLCSRHQCA